MELQKEIIAQIAQHLGVTPQDIDHDASLKEDLGLGPIELADMLAALSTIFNVTFNPADVQRLHTVSDLVELIEDLSLEE
jgi:acyl carrier protein